LGPRRAAHLNSAIRRVRAAGLSAGGIIRGMHTSDPLPRECGSIVLRRLNAADLGAFQAYRHDALLGLYQGWSAMSDADASAFLAEMGGARLFEPGTWCQIGIAESGSDELIGDIGICLDAEGIEAEIGFTLRRPSQGRGLAGVAVGEAIRLIFERTAARRVLGISDARNAASLRLMERIGMRCIESRRTVFRGEACVERVFELLRG